MLGIDLIECPNRPGNLKLTKKRCAADWKSAARTADSPCYACPIGAENAGMSPRQAKASRKQRGKCPRCGNPAARFVRGVCVSCRNREYEGAVTTHPVEVVVVTTHHIAVAHIDSLGADELASRQLRERGEPVHYLGFGRLPIGQLSLWGAGA